MPPKAEQQQAAWPAGTDVAAAHRARAAAVKAKASSYEVPYTTSGGKKETKSTFIAAGKMPVFMEHGVNKSDKRRASQRPSKMAKGLSHKGVRSCPDLIPSGFDGNDDSWVGSEDMPDEAKEEDIAGCRARSSATSRRSIWAPTVTASRSSPAPQTRCSPTRAGRRTSWSGC